MSTSRFSTIPGAPTGHAGSVSIASLTLALREAQLENDQLIETIRELKDRVGELEAEKATRKRGRKGRSSKNAAPACSGDEEQVDDPETKLTSIAKRFCILHRLWAPEASFGQQPPKSSSDPSYFGSREQWTLGISAEIYEVVPSELHHLLSTARISSLFRNAMGAQRVAMAHSLKTCAPRIFAKIDIPESVFATVQSRAASERLQALLKWNIDKPGFPALAPILYDPELGRDFPFQNSVLPLILRVILFGPSSLTSRPAANSSGRKWEVSQVTPGGICLSAVMARFLISEDTELSPIGSATNIDYEQAYHTYHKFLHEVSSTPYWSRLVKFYQTITFADVPNTSNNNTSTFDVANENMNDNEDFSHALRVAQAQYDSDGDDNDNDTPSVPPSAPLMPLHVSSATPLAPHAPPRRSSTPPLSYISDVVDRLRIDDDAEFELPPLTPSTSTHTDHDLQLTDTRIEPTTAIPTPQYDFGLANVRFAIDEAPARFGQRRGAATTRFAGRIDPTATPAHTTENGQRHDAVDIPTGASSRRGRARGAGASFEQPATTVHDDNGLDSLVGRDAPRGRGRGARGRGRSADVEIETPVAQQQPRRASQRKAATRS